MDWIARHRKLVLASICAFCTGIILLTLIRPDWPFLSSIVRGDESFGDMLRREGRQTPTRDDFVFLGVDESTMNFQPLHPEDAADNRAFQLLLEHPQPYSRELWALLLDRVFAAGARLVMFDMIFGKPGEGDEAFRAALDRYHDKVVLGANYDENSQIFVWPSPTLIEDAEHDDRAGYVIYFPDPVDGVIRTIRYFLSDRQLAGIPPRPDQEIFASLSARVIHKIGEDARLPRDLEQHYIRFSSPNVYNPKPIWEIFDSKVWAAPVSRSGDTGSGYGGGAFFKDKVVIVGAASQIAHDVVPTPLGPSMPGPVLHLHAIAAVLAGEFLHLTPYWLRVVLICAAGLLAWVLIAFVRRPVVSLISLGAVSIGYVMLARVLYDHGGLILMTVPILTGFLSSGSLSLGWEYILERREKLKTRRTLERYVSKNLVKEILENPGGYYNTLKGTRMPVTVLFSDLIGFTNLTEHSKAEDVVSHLNELFSAMVNVVFENNGTLDKFIGDAIMAVWGNVRSAGAREDAKAAAHTALGMRKALKVLNARWTSEGILPLGMGMGINHGEAIVGNIGSSAPHERLDPTVIGDAVNLASRLEALTRNYGVDILVGEAAVGLISDDFVLRSVAKVQVKGKTIPVAVSALLCAKGEEYDGAVLNSLEAYEEGIAQFRTREFTKAKTNFERFLSACPKDYLAQMYFDRAMAYEKEPPDESWNGAEVFTKK